MNDELAALDGASLRTGLNACVEAGRIGEAEALMRGIRDARLRPGHGAYNILIKYHAARGDGAAATRFLKQMRLMGYTPDRITFNTLAHCFGVAGDAVRARAVVDKAAREGVPPDVRTWHPYLLVLARAGDVRGVCAALREMAAAGLPRTAWTASVLVQACVCAGDVEGAESAARDAGWCPTSGRQPVVSNLLLQVGLWHGPWCGCQRGAPPS